MICSMREALRELRVPELQDDFRPARQLARRLDLVAGLSVARPDPALLSGQIRAREDGHLFRDHERRVKADAELPDEVSRRPCCALSCSRNAFDPECAMVPRFSISSPCVMPMPASVKVIVFAWSSVATLILSGALRLERFPCRRSGGTSASPSHPRRWKSARGRRFLCRCKASAMTISSNCPISAWKACFSVVLDIGPRTLGRLARHARVRRNSEVHAASRARMLVPSASTRTNSTSPRCARDCARTRLGPKR